MNYIITHKCNKGCSYCFAQEKRSALYKEGADEMTVEQFYTFLMKDKDANVKLLGGEPTSHPQFEQFLETVLTKTNKSLNIISNFLFSEEVMEMLIKYIQLFLQNGRKITFLVNSSELDLKNRMEVFKRNYTMIYSLLYKFDIEGSMNCGITLEQNKDINFYIRYIDYLLLNLQKIENFRISIEFPGTVSEKKTDMYINDFETGKKIISIVKFLIGKNIPIHLDCVIFPCMFENKEQFKYVKNFLHTTKFRCGDGGCPADLFSNGETIYCYPLKDSTGANLNEHKHTAALRANLETQYKILESNIEKPEACKVCRYFGNICKGPCLGLYAQSEIDSLGIDFD